MVSIKVNNTLRSNDDTPESFWEDVKDEVCSNICSIINEGMDTSDLETILNMLQKQIKKDKIEIVNYNS
jgi:hypothetical protein